MYWYDFGIEGGIGYVGVVVGYCGDGVGYMGVMLV